MVDNVKEAIVEAALVRAVEARGGLCEKVAPRGRRGFPDRMIILPGPRIAFCELKRPKGGRISRHQIEYARRLEALGVVVAVVRNQEDIARLLART